MKISYEWLRQYLPVNLSPEEISVILTDNGLEVEALELFENVKGSLSGVVTGLVSSCSKIEGTDHLHLTQVDVGTEQLQIVCGAPNVAEGQKVLVALPGTTLYFHDGKEITIRKAKVRGVESNGMICAEDELGLGSSHDGIMVLPGDTNIGKPAAEVLNVYTDHVFEIGLTPNRSDAMCHTGVARDVFSALRNRLHLTNIQLQIPDVSMFDSDDNSIPAVVEVVSPEACLRYNGLILSNMKVTESPQWLKNRLEAVGLRPINIVVDVTQFVMLETGQPLHAFDYDKIEGGKVVVRKLAAGTSFVTLDGIERKLGGDDLMICDAEKAMCIAGVFGGVHSGVTMQTTQVFLESACFDPVHIRKTARSHGLHTDASFRFERGTAPDVTVYALKRAAILLKELTGCRISSHISDFSRESFQKPNIEISVELLNHFAGVCIQTEEVRSILEDLDFEVRQHEGDRMLVAAPFNRTDVLRNVDVYEEVLRIYGYNRIPMPEKANMNYSVSMGTSLHQLVQKSGDHLASSGFREIMCNSLCSRDWFQQAGVFDMDSLVQLQNPLSRELNVMRISMLPGMLQSMAHNINRNSPNLRLFEVGKVYRKKSDDKAWSVVDRFAERNVLAIGLTGSLRPENWKYAEEKPDFYLLKAMVERFLNFCGLPNGWQCDDVPGDEFIAGLRYILDGKTLAVAGQVRSSLCALSGVESDVWFAEIDMDVLLNMLRGRVVRFGEIPKFPSIRRDLSLLIDRNITFALLRDAAMRADRKILREVNLFDVYTDQKMGEHKKSYAISFVFRHDEKTLTDADADKAMERILNEVLKASGGSIR